MKVKYPQENINLFEIMVRSIRFLEVRVFSSFMIAVREHLRGGNPESGKKIGVVTHGGFLGAIFRYVLKIPLDAERNFVLLNCSVNRLEKAESGWNLVSWGDVAHLEGLDSLDDA